MFLVRERKISDIIGVIRKIDKLGRIVIPKEFRERFKLYDDVELIVTNEGVLLRNPKYILVKKENENL